MPLFVELARVDAEFVASERAVVARYLRRALEAFDAVIEPQPPPSEA
jgi:hypothetical protein